MTLYQYSGSGTLLESNQSQELKSSSYNNSSVLLYTTEDYGKLFLTIDNTSTTLDGINYTLDGGLSTTLSEDYGNFSPPSEKQDYNIIVGFGATETLYPFGKLTLSGSAITAGNYRLYFFGSAKTTFVRSPDNLGGTLFGFGEKTEKRSYSYNLSSIENTNIDYGSVASITTQVDDYESITLDGVPVEYGLINEPTGGIITPFGKLTLSGSALTQPNYRLYFFGSAKTKVSYRPLVQTINLFEFGQKIESITFVYNKSSTIQNILDYGSISSTYGESPDYGLISDIGGTQPPDNYGLITETVPDPISYSFGSLFLSGSVSDIKLVHPQIGTGTFTLSGNLNPPNIDYTPAYTGFGNIFISGSAIYKEADSYVSTGTLFGFGSKIERVTYAYNKSSIVDSSEDFGLIGDPFTLSNDYGFISLPSDQGIDNYGIIGPIITTSFGGITLSGSSVEKFDKGLYTGSGTLTLSGTLVEKFTSGAGESTQLFQLSGGNVYSEINNYVASGTLFGFGEKKESRTYAYNQQSISDNLLDYGFISNTNPSQEDYQYIALPPGPQPSDDYGLINQVISSSTIPPYGSIVISGSALISKPTNPPENTQLFIISGSALEKDIDSYVGLGTAILSAVEIERRTKSYVGVGTIRMDAVGVTTSSLIARTRSYVALGTVFLSGSGVEKFAPNPPENTQLFVVSGAYSNLKATKSNVGLGTVVLSGVEVERRTKSYVGLGTAFEFGSGLTPRVKSYIGLGTVFLSGSGIEKFAPNPPENTQLFVVSGAYSNLKATKSNVGLGTVVLSGVEVERRTKSYVGLGTVFLSGSATYAKIKSTGVTGITVISGVAKESRTVYIPRIGVGTGGIGGNITISNISTRYYSPVYPRNALPGDPSSGIGTIQIYYEARTRAVLPVFGKGGINISGSKFESFTRTTYIGIGSISISGISPTREIDVFTGVGSGTITLTPRTLVERTVHAYAGSGGTITLSQSSRTVKRNSYDGTGVISIASISANSRVIKPTTDSLLYNVYGSANVSKISNPPENTQLFTISGAYSNLKKTKSYSGIGTVTISGAAKTPKTGKFVGSGSIRFATHTVDNLYDTVDSTNIFSDYLNDAKVRFVANPPENTQLFVISGNGITSKRISRPYVGIAGTFTISGSATNVKKSKSYAGIGTIFEISSGTTKRIRTVNGSGTIAILSGSAKSLTKRPTTSSVLYTISGIASTKINHIVRISGIGTVTLSGISATKKLTRVPISGIGTITISGQVIPPNVKFVPKPKTSGTITILGSGKQSLTKKSVGSGSIFVISSGKQSFTRKTYLGIGTIYIQSIAGITVNNPYQIPRVYVTII